VPKTIADIGLRLFFAVRPAQWRARSWWIRVGSFGRPSSISTQRAPSDPGDRRRSARAVDSFARFALQGLGTPAPIAPTQNLVVTGLYRYVRNPIYVALSPSSRPSALFGDQRLLAYGVLVWLAFTRLSWVRGAGVVRTFERSTRISGPTSALDPRLTPWRAARRRNHS